MKLKESHVKTIKISVKGGHSLGDAIPEAVILAMKEEVDVIIVYNDTHIKIDRQKILSKLYKQSGE